MPLYAVALVLLSAGLHAGWNAVVRSQRDTDSFLRISLIIGAVGLLPAFAGEIIGPAILPIAGPWIILTSIFLAIYYVGLSRGYRLGDFTMVYPLVRALPLLLIAVADWMRGTPPSPQGWLGLVLVAAGCLIIPLENVRQFSIARYWNRTTLWIVIAALGTVVYTTVDSIAAQAMPQGPIVAMRYHVFEDALTFVTYGLALKLQNQPVRFEPGWRGWQRASLAALMLFIGYSLVLLTLQLTPHASYVMALRQFSIVIGVIVGALVFREAAARLRLVAAFIIVLGLLCIATA